MGSIIKEFNVDSDVTKTWEKVSSVGDVTELLAGMITECQLDGDKRRCTFADGMEVEEKIISVDHQAKRLSYTVTQGPMPIDFHMASIQVSDSSDGTKLVWTVDITPQELVEPISGMMDMAISIMKTNLQ